MAPVAHTHISFDTNSISENGRQQLDAMLFDGIRITAILHCKLAHQHSISVLFKLSDDAHRCPDMAFL